MKKRSGGTMSSGNVFKDLGLPAADELHTKAELVAKIATLISSRGLTQTAAAKALGIDQPKVSLLLRGHLSGFSTERLMKFLTALGSNVQIVIQDRPRAKGPGRLRVLSKAS